MAEIRTVHTARKIHDCDAHPCSRAIQPGERYLLASLPPSDEGNGTVHWLRMKVCQPCVERWGQAVDEQATPRRSPRPRRLRTRHAAIETVPSRPHHDEPRFDRPIVNVPLPA